MDGNDNLEIVAEDSVDVLLRQLFHLKGYESPCAVRMTKSKQNIMRQVREVNGRKRRNVSDLLEVNIPWFFAEPKYGVALLFVAIASLQYLGISSRDVSQNQTGIYTIPDGMTSFQQPAVIPADKVSYPKLPDHLDLFPDQQSDAGVKFVGRIETKK